MKTRFHPNLNLEKWSAQPYSRQLLNIASELTRARQGLHAHDVEMTQRSLERAFELIDLTASANQGKKSLKELLRLRESLAGYYAGQASDENEFYLLLCGLLNMDRDVHALGIEVDPSLAAWRRFREGNAR